MATQVGGVNKHKEEKGIGFSVQALSPLTEGELLICVSSNGAHTVGKGYLVKNGLVGSDIGAFSKDWAARFVRSNPPSLTPGVVQGSRPLRHFTTGSAMWPKDPLCPEPENQTKTPEASSKTDPSHYTKFAIQPMTFSLRNGLPDWKSHAVKYVCRAGHKEYTGLTDAEAEIEDIKKAIRWMQGRINLLNGETEL